jgi:hypothetical protein
MNERVKGLEGVIKTKKKETESETSAPAFTASLLLAPCSASTGVSLSSGRVVFTTQGKIQ